MKKLIMLCMLVVVGITTGCSATPKVGDTETQTSHTELYDAFVTVTMDTEDHMTVDSFIKMKIDNPNVDINKACDAYETSLTKAASKSWALKGHSASVYTTVMMGNGDTFNCNAFNLNM